MWTTAKSQLQNVTKMADFNLQCQSIQLSATTILTQCVCVCVCVCGVKGCEIVFFRRRKKFVCSFVERPNVVQASEIFKSLNV